MLLPSCFLTGFVRLPASAPPFHLAVARYAFDEMPAHLLDNRTKPVKDANDRLRIKEFISADGHINMFQHFSLFLVFVEKKIYICKR
ncbi:hypothetical protein [Prevotella falsenii]